MSKETNLEQLKLFSVAPLVNQPLAPGSDEARRMTVGSGMTLLDSLKLLNRAGAFSRTLLEYLVCKGEFHSTKCFLNWKTRATKSNRLLFQLAASVPRTGGIESGLLPTARVSMANGPSKKEIEEDNPKGRLETEVAMLPTPRAGNPGSRPNKKGGKILNEEVGKRTGLKLHSDFVMWMMNFPIDWCDFPTEQKSAMRSGGSKR